MCLLRDRADLGEVAAKEETIRSLGLELGELAGILRRLRARVLRLVDDLAAQRLELLDEAGAEALRIRQVGVGHDSHLAKAELVISKLGHNRTLEVVRVAHAKDVR